jgi:hypothetical protein
MLRSARRSGTSGQALIEFAVVFPLLAVILVVIIDGGFLMGRYNHLVHTAEEGTQFAATGASENEIVAKVKEQAQGVLDDAPSGSSCSGPRPSVCIQYSDGESGQVVGEVGSTVMVTVRYEHEFLLPFWTPGLPPLVIDACIANRLERPVPSAPDSNQTRC